jgi:hypothetical protein
MDIRKPKQWHGVREFLKEYAIIVIGVLTALAAEQAVEAVREHHAAAESREAIYREIRQNLSFMKGRLKTQACVEKRLDEIGSLLAKAGEGPMAPPPQWVGQPSTWFMASQRWQVATESGHASLFDADEQDRLADVYVITTHFADAEHSEQAAWAQLRGLETWTGPLGNAGRVHFASALQSARYELWDIRASIGLAFDRAKVLGIADNEARTMGGGHAIPHAVCLPIGTPRDKALAVLARSSTPWGQPK